VVSRPEKLLSLSYLSAETGSASLGNAKIDYQPIVGADHFGLVEWRTIYLRKKAQGKPAKQALVVVAVKLPHAVYAMLKHRQPYNPSRLLVAPATSGS
jgi:hypothetical protein